MKILLSTLGTAGDIVPFVRLSKRLLARGHRVTVHCPDPFGSWFPSAARATPSAGGISIPEQELIFELALHERDPIAQKFHFARWFYGLGEGEERARAYHDRAREVFKEHDLALINSLDHIGQVVAEHAGMPWACYSSRPPPDPAVADPPNAGIDAELSRLLSRVSGRPCVARTFRSMSPLLTLAACSPAIAPTGLPTVRVTGAWLEPSRPRALPAQLEAFLSSGPALFTTFGTMPDVNERTRKLIVAAQQCGWRTIVQVLDSKPLPPALPESILVTRERLPFDVLLPRVRAVVHHGGAGTTHEILRAGRPSLVIPYMGDQFYWAAILERRGLGPQSISSADLVPAALADRMTKLRQQEYAQRAAALAPEIAAQNGLSVAVELLETVSQEIA